MRKPSKAETAESDRLIDEVAKGDEKVAAHVKLAARVDSILEGCDELIAVMKMVGTMSVAMAPAIGVDQASEVFSGIAVIMDDMVTRVEAINETASSIAYGRQSGGAR
ncbi:MAG: hypothetical protein ABJA98_19220 [Acidobacteriota bacterium]